MVAVGERPVPATPAIARAALEAHLPTVLGNRTLEDAGWRRPGPLTLLVPLAGHAADGSIDQYLLRLGFTYYPAFPPTAEFVNPATMTYRFPDDRCHLPLITGTNEISVHPQYEGVNQLICCSFVAEFYIVGHGVEPRHLWDPQRHTFAATISAVRFGLGQPYYQGRQA